jgi:rhodanese-related sulfurtransferase
MFLTHLMEVNIMRASLYILLAIAAVSMIALAGCNSTDSKAGPMAKATPGTATQAAAPVDDVHRISISEAKAEFDGGKAVIIDVRGEPTFKAGHIKGAQMIAFQDIATKSGELPKDKTIILYCSCPAEHSSVAAAQILKGKNVTNTAALVGGYPAWKEAGYPIEEAPKQ